MQLNELQFRAAMSADLERIWQIISQGIARRKAEGSSQWQDGYPNLQTLRADIRTASGFVLAQEGHLLAYAALINGIEPAYEGIDGEWLTSGTYLVIHRVAVADEGLGKGLAGEIFRQAETLARQWGIHAIRVDTNFDNAPMLHILEREGYVYCGTVYFRGAERLAYEKVL